MEIDKSIGEYSLVCDSLGCRIEGYAEMLVITDENVDIVIKLCNYYNKAIKKRNSILEGK